MIMNEKLELLCRLKAFCQLMLVLINDDDPRRNDVMTQLEVRLDELTKRELH